MTVYKYVELFLTFFLDPGNCIVKVVYNWILQNVFDGQYLMTVDQWIDGNSYITLKVLSHIQVKIARMLLLLKRSSFRVLTTSPRYRPPSPSEGLNMQFIFSSFLLLTINLLPSACGTTRELVMGGGRWAGRG